MTIVDGVVRDANGEARFLSPGRWGCSAGRRGDPHRTEPPGGVGGHGGVRRV